MYQAILILVTAYRHGDTHSTVVAVSFCNASVLQQSIFDLVKRVLTRSRFWSSFPEDPEQITPHGW
jgi:hypothetical protein